MRISGGVCFVPAKTSRENIDALNASIGKILGKEDVIKKLMVQGIEPIISTPEKFAEIVHSDIERWAKLAKAINLQPE